MLAQPLLIWLALWCSHAIDWPLRRESQPADRVKLTD